jgi:hypothetical protein
MAVRHGVQTLPSFPNMSVIGLSVASVLQESQIAMGGNFAGRLQTIRLVLVDMA